MKTHTVFLLILCLAACLMVMSNIRPPADHFHGIVYDVRVINGFNNNSSLPLVIWCSSRDSDIGGRALQEGDDFSWSVEAKFWDTSTDLFFCTMKWDQKRKSFEAFQVGRDRQKCGPLRKCSWKSGKPCSISTTLPEYEMARFSFRHYYLETSPYRVQDFNSQKSFDQNDYSSYSIQVSWSLLARKKATSHEKWYNSHWAM
ncbi:hypothetical protein F0562_000250 [Nyssa sinensis]|uniref:S-protein homolog n=1 Tax=Nyssa sinensis TaxID=561372 RepID=A0A5J5BZ48_9ASTE|nr:hypothetical protein F0562_000250 [Nyssa sinensis]